APAAPATPRPPPPSASGSPRRPGPPGSTRSSSTAAGSATTAASRPSPTPPARADWSSEPPGPAPRGPPNPEPRKTMAELLDEQSQLESTTVSVDRTSATVKGGRRFSFGALVVVGDRRGRVG